MFLLTISVFNFRGVSGVCEKTLIINLPGSQKASKECLQVISSVIPHAVSLIRDKKEVSKQFHEQLSDQVVNVHFDESKVPVCHMISSFIVNIESTYIVRFK